MMRNQRKRQLFADWKEISLEVIFIWGYFGHFALNLSESVTLLMRLWIVIIKRRMQIKLQDDWGDLSVD